jgi:hypothetical protein
MDIISEKISNVIFKVFDKDNDNLLSSSEYLLFMKSIPTEYKTFFIKSGTSLKLKFPINIEQLKMLVKSLGTQLDDFNNYIDNQYQYLLITEDEVLKQIIVMFNNELTREKITILCKLLFQSHYIIDYSNINELLDVLFARKPEINKEELSDFLKNVLKINIKKINIDLIFANRRLTEIQEENMNTLNQAATKINDGEFCTESDDPDSQITISIFTHGAELNTLFNPNENIYVMNSVPCGYLAYVGCSNDMHIVEKQLALRDETRERPLYYIEPKLRKFSALTSEAYEKISKNILTPPKLQHSCLTKEQCFRGSIPIHNRNYSIEPLRDKRFMGCSILHWKNNPRIDNILEQCVTPNIYDPHISSVHLVENLYTIVYNIIKRQHELTRQPMDLSKLPSPSQNVVDYLSINEIPMKTYMDYLAKSNINMLYAKLSEIFSTNDNFNRIFHKLNKANNTDEINFTLQDITDLFTLLGYKKIIILDTGCRAAFSSQNTNNFVSPDDPSNFIQYHENPEYFTKMQEESEMRLKPFRFGGRTKRYKKNRKHKHTKKRKHIKQKTNLRRIR